MIVRDSFVAFVVGKLTAKATMDLQLDRP